MNMDEIVNYPIEFFNSLHIPGVPQHVLSFKIDAPVILRNINPLRRCNGTRLAVKNMMLKRRVIGISGSLIWSKTLMELTFNPCGEFG